MRACIIALICFSWCTSSIGQANTISAPSESFERRVLSQEVPDFSVTRGTLLSSLESLSSGPVPFRLGFEGVLSAKFGEAVEPDPHFDLHLQNKTVREILNALCFADPRYTWSVEDATVNVYPRASVDDMNYLPNRRLNKFELKGITNIDQGLLAIYHQLPPPEEQIGHAQMGGDSSYPLEPWTATFEALTVRQAINRLVAHMGPRACWTFHGSRDFRTFTFFRSGFQPDVGTGAAK